MISDQKTIKMVLKYTKDIFCYDIGDEKVMLVYDNDKLVRISPFGGLAHKLLSDIKLITFHCSLKAWEVIWKV